MRGATGHASALLPGPCSLELPFDGSRERDRTHKRASSDGPRAAGADRLSLLATGAGLRGNLQTEDAVTASIEYIHLNPVRRGLCKSPVDRPWSSARWHATEGTDIDARLPKLHGPPPELFRPCR